MKRFFNDSTESSNNFKRKRKGEIPVREEVKWLTKMLLDDPDLEYRPTKRNELTWDDCLKIHHKRLDKYRRSRVNGRMEYMGPKGGIYTITARGNKSYLY